MAIGSDDSAALVGAAADGDRSAWAELVQRYHRCVWAVARSHGLSNADAEEVFQTTWLRLVENLHRIKEPDRLGGWLTTTARREVLGLIRSRTRVVPTDMGVIDRASDEVTPEQAWLDREQRDDDERRLREVWTAFGDLPERCQELLRLLISSPPLSYAEIAATLEIAIGSIGPTRARCLQRLRELMAEPDGAGGRRERARQRSS
jgi:RNA polymerase sigma factor (sigma-70 family)